jgi:hypothetical protein
LEKTYWMLKVILTLYDHLAEALHQGMPLEQALAPALLDQIARMKEWPPNVASNRARELLGQIEGAFR